MTLAVHNWVLTDDMQVSQMYERYVADEVLMLVM
jgi:hypothetical protein